MKLLTNKSIKATIKAYEKVIALYYNNKFLIRLIFKHPLGREKILQLLHGKSEFYTVSFGNGNGYVKVSNVYQQAETLAETKNFLSVSACKSLFLYSDYGGYEQQQRITKTKSKMYKCNKNVMYEDVIK